MTGGVKRLALTDLDLKKIDSVSWVIDVDVTRPAALDPFILDMHTKNGLIADITAGKGMHLWDVEVEIIDTLRQWGIEGDRTTPLCGSSLRLDRNFLEYYMPIFHEQLSYRTIDVSSFKETLMRYKPAVYKAWREQYPDDDKAHRVLDDIDWSIQEYGFYLKELGLR